jgi:TetR/AcrR family transcriptional regulator, transcriptional repressor for nem operon
MTEAVSTRDRILNAAEGLVLRQGFNATTLDAILAEAGASKGAFFHHFASKEALGNALVERYADADAVALERFMGAAEELSDDPAEQVVHFVRLYEEAAHHIPTDQPGCLFVSFIYERGPGSPRDEDVIVESIELWRNRILAKLELAAETRPRLAEVDLSSLADMVFSTFEGGFILARATDDPEHLRRQLGHLRKYLELLIESDDHAAAAV